MATFKVEEREFEIKPPRGRNGRRATNYLITKASFKEGEETNVTDLLAMLDEKEFLEIHLPAFLSKEDAKYVDEHATTGELLNMIMAILGEVFEGFSTPEMDAALKNLPGAQAEEGEE